MFGALSGIVHVDGKGKRLGNYLLPAGDTISEPVFVERGDDAAEGDGWLLAAVWRARENRSDLAVFNAQRCRGRARSRWCISAIACPTAFTATGSGRRKLDECNTLRHSGLAQRAAIRNDGMQ